jgi:uncharacterized protein YvpB
MFKNLLIFFAATFIFAFTFIGVFLLLIDLNVSENIFIKPSNQAIANEDTPVEQIQEMKAEEVFIEILSVTSSNPFGDTQICVRFDSQIDSNTIKDIYINKVPNKFYVQNMSACTDVTVKEDLDIEIVVPKTVKDINGSSLKQQFVYTLSHQSKFESVNLPITYSAQKYSTSCVLAAGKMALSKYNINVSEDELYTKMGQSYPIEHRCSGGSTPYTNGTVWSCPNNEGLIWGDWDAGFLGQLDGTLKGTGGGASVNVAGLRAVKKYAPGSFNLTGSETDVLFGEVKKGHPVIYSRDRDPSNLHYCWNTTENRQLCDIGAKHAKVLAGYTYNRETETYSDIIVYDSIFGILHYSYDEFRNDYFSNGKEAISVVL